MNASPVMKAEASTSAVGSFSSPPSFMKGEQLITVIFSYRSNIGIIGQIAQFSQNSTNDSGALQKWKRGAKKHVYPYIILQYKRRIAELNQDDKHIQVNDPLSRHPRSGLFLNIYS